VTAKRPYRADDLLAIRTVADPQIAPDGSKVAYVVTSADADADEFRSAIWIAPLDGSGAPRQLTRGAHRDSQPRWSPDGRTLAFASNRPPIDGNGKSEAKPRSQIWLMGESGEPYQLTRALLGADAPAWSPDGTRLLYRTRTRSSGETKRPDDRSPVEKNAPRVLRDVIYRFDGEGQYDGSWQHVWVTSVGDDVAEPQQLTHGDTHDVEPAWTSDGEQIIFTSTRGERRGKTFQRDVWAVALSDGAARRLSTGDGPANLPVCSPDSSRIAYAGHRQGEAPAVNSTIWTVALSGGEPESLTEELDRSVLGVATGGAVAWSPDGASIYFLTMDLGASRLCRVHAGGGAVEALTGIDRYITGFSLAADGRSVAYTAATGSNPTELYVLPLDGGESRAVTAHNAPLRDSVHLAAYEPVCFTGADGWEIGAWLVRPFGHQQGEKFPLVLDVHGGPHGMHGQNFQPAVQEMAARGYGVLLVNPRGSTGYGESFTRACVEDWGGKDYEDLMAGVDWAIAEAGADPARLFVTGYSYGGFMTSWVVGHTNRFRAAVCGAPVAEFAGFYGESDIGTTFGVTEHGGQPWERWEAFRAGSPFTHIVNCVTPFLLLHWEGDLRCPISQSEILFAALNQLQREVEFVRYPGGFHTYLTHAPSQRIDATRRTTDWFEAHGGNCAQAARPAAAATA
jgi:dipeptidyl aminopeptidase/acylaminoacyl peptidase